MTKYICMVISFILMGFAIFANIHATRLYKRMMRFKNDVFPNEKLYDETFIKWSKWDMLPMMAMGAALLFAIAYKILNSQ